MSNNFEVKNLGVNELPIGFTSLGKTILRTDIPSSMTPFAIFPEYKIKYPQVVIQALGKIYQEYNNAFDSLKSLNQEWGLDYRFAQLANKPVNWMVQIDMVGLSDEFLRNAHTLTEDDLNIYLRRRIYEIENSVAMYSLLQQSFLNEGVSQFKTGFQKSLDELRSRYQMPIALLAVTDEKYEAMRSTEFGKTMDDPLSDEEVRNISGFDRFFGPGGFIKHLRSNGGKCKYLLYVRSSDPARKLKNPNEIVEHLLLSDPEIRRVIKECSVTLNVDNPEWIGSDPRRINDSKLYMPQMNMGYPILNESFLWNKEFNDFISISRSRYRDFENPRLSEQFINFLTTQGVDPENVENGSVQLRAKPALATFGCYGHLRGTLTDAGFRKELRRLMRQRGGYIIQPEIDMSELTDSVTGEKYAYIDRNFFSVTSGAPVFIGGVRNLTSTSSFEAMRGRGHGNDTSVFAEIIT